MASSLGKHGRLLCKEKGIKLHLKQWHDPQISDNLFINYLNKKLITKIDCQNKQIYNYLNQTSCACLFLIRICK